MNQLTPIMDLLTSKTSATGAGSVEPISALSTALVSQSAFRPFPTIEDRAGWKDISNELTSEFISAGDSAARYNWPSLLAVRYLDFKRNGNRTRYAATYNERRSKLASLVFAECCVDDGTHLDQIMNGIWLICEESSWCVPAHIHSQKAGSELPEVREPIIDLFAAETAVLLSWIYYLLKSRLDPMSPHIGSRIITEISARILEPYLARNDLFWMGFSGIRVNNWNPWINSNVLACILLIEADGHRRAEMVEKTMRSVDCFLGPYPVDGGCDEGPSYWGRAGASLFDYLELLDYATGGQINGFILPIVGEIGRFIYRVHIDDEQYVNFADAPAVVSPPGELVERFGGKIKDSLLEGFGTWLVNRERIAHPVVSGRAGIARGLPAIFWNEKEKKTRGSTPLSPPLPRDVWLDDIQVVVARDNAGTSSGFFLAAKGGHNDESHNHNDIGSFIVFVDGRPLIVDAGVETYRRQTFSDERYSIWTMQSAFHSLLPTIDGVMQVPGVTYKARDVAYAQDDASVRFSQDISGAWPESANLETWYRTITLFRGDRVAVDDRSRFTVVPSKVEMSLLTACDVVPGAAGVIGLQERIIRDGRKSGEGRVVFDASRFGIDVETISIDDERMINNWGDKLFRIIFTRLKPELVDQFSFSISKA